MQLRRGYELDVSKINMSHDQLTLLPLASRALPARYQFLHFLQTQSLIFNMTSSFIRSFTSLPKTLFRLNHGRIVRLRAHPWPLRPQGAFDLFTHAGKVQPRALNPATYICNELLAIHLSVSWLIFRMNLRAQWCITTTEYETAAGSSSEHQRRRELRLFYPSRFVFGLMYLLSCGRFRLRDNK